MKKLTLALSLLFSLVAGATERSEAEMQKIASNELFGVMTRSAFTPDLQKVETGNTYSIYSAQGRGFVVVSTDDAFEPVLGVSFTEYDAENMPCGFKWWLSAISSEMEKGINNAEPSISKRRAVKVPEPVESFITARWGQGAPYNTKCPFVSGARGVTGCAATAMAQIMKYYQYPAKGVGQNTYSIGDKNGNVTSQKTVSITGTYDWANMLDDYNVGKPTTTQKFAVATLMADCGAASNMLYMPGSSGTSIEDTGEGFIDHFGYNNVSLMHYYKMFYDDDEWTELVYDELKNKRPVLYGGMDNTFGGHAFVLDGIDNEGKVHVNWGWDGAADGYYQLLKLDPNPTGTSYNFANDEQMICGIKVPTANDNDVPVSQWVSVKPYSFSIAGNDTLILSMGNIFNADLRSFYGDIVIAIENTNGVPEDCLFGEMWSSEEYGVKQGTINAGYGFVLEEDDGSPSQMKYTGMSSSNVKPGTYRLYVMTCGYTEGELPQYLRAPGGVIIYTMDKKANGTISVYEGDPLVANGIESVTAAGKSNVQGIFNLNGMRMLSMQKGINIIKNAEGNVMKVMAK